MCISHFDPSRHFAAAQQRIALSSTMEVGWALRHVGGVPNSRMGQHNTELTPSPPTNLPDRYSGGAPGDQKKVRRHIVELDAHGDALRQTHPAEGRIDERQ